MAFMRGRMECVRACSECMEKMQAGMQCTEGGHVTLCQGAFTNRMELLQGGMHKTPSLVQARLHSK